MGGLGLRKTRKRHAVIGLRLGGRLAGDAARCSIVWVVGARVLLLGIGLLARKVTMRGGDGAGSCWGHLFLEGELGAGENTWSVYTFTLHLFAGEVVHGDEGVESSGRVNGFTVWVDEWRMGEGVLGMRW